MEFDTKFIIFMVKKFGINCSKKGVAGLRKCDLRFNSFVRKEKTNHRLWLNQHQQKQRSKLR